MKNAHFARHEKKRHSNAVCETIECMFIFPLSIVVVISIFVDTPLSPVQCACAQNGPFALENLHLTKQNLHGYQLKKKKHFPMQKLNKKREKICS